MPEYSTALIAFDEIQEGFRAKAYPDGNKPDGSIDYACGFGTHGPDVNANTVWTRDYATTRLLATLNETCAVVNRVVKVSLTTSEVDALTSFAENVGVGKFETSTLVRLLNAGDKRAAGDEFLKWKWKHIGKVLVEDQGLYARRVKERAMFLAGDWYAKLELPPLAPHEPEAVPTKPVPTSTIITKGADMKTATHTFAAILTAVCGALCVPSIHAAVLSFAAKDPYLTVLATCVLGLAALYHNPKKQ